MRRPTMLSSNRTSLLNGGLRRHSCHMLSVAALALGLVAGCGGDGVRHANVSAGPMPDGQTFTGVWHSPQYGEMQVIQTGAHIVGEYTRDERTGRIQGTAQGDLLRFEWQEERELIRGRPTTTRGHGYFQFQIGGDGDAYIVGEWGHDDNETGGGPWRAARDRRRQPHLSTASGTSGGDDSSRSGDGLEDLGPSSTGSSSSSSSSSTSSDDGLGDDLDGL
jgi:hypothetical protein